MIGLCREYFANCTEVWVEGWRQPVPKFPKCGISLLPTALLAYCVFVGIPHIIKVLCRRKDKKRPFTALLCVELLSLASVFINNIVRSVLIHSDPELYSWEELYTSLTFVFATVLYCSILFSERLRNAKSSGVCFFYVLFCSVVAAIRCWNHWIDHVVVAPDIQPQASNNSISLPTPVYVTQVSVEAGEAGRMVHITDAVNLIGYTILLIMTCFSERMIQYNRALDRIHNRSRTCLFRNLLNKSDSKAIDGQKPKATAQAGEETVIDPDKIEELQLPSPERHASYLSRVIYAWFLRMIVKGYRKPLELKDLWRLDHENRAQTISEAFLRSVDRYVIPEKTINHYMERRRMSLLSATVDTTNANHSMNVSADRRQSTQSALGVGRPVDGHNTYKSGYAEAKLSGLAWNRRASEGPRLRDNYPSESETTLPDERTLPGRETELVCESDNLTGDADAKRTNLSSGLNRRGSVSMPEGIPSESVDCLDDQTEKTKSIGHISAAPVGILGLQRHSSTRRSVRIRVGSKPAFLPGQSESRSDSVLMQPNEDQLAKIGESTEESLKSPQHAVSHVPQSGTQTATRGDDTSVEFRPDKRQRPSYGSEFEADHGPSKHSKRCLCCTGKSPRLGLLNALMGTFWRPLLWSGILKLIHDILVFFNPALLKLLLRFLQDGFEEPVWHGYLYAVLMLATSFFQTLLLQRYFKEVHTLGMHLRTAITCAVYRKSLRLSNTARRESTSGQIMNLISSDVQNFVLLMPFLNIIWSGPFQIIVAVVFLWNELGPSVLAGIAVLLLLLPLNAITARLSKKVQEKKFKMADSRIKMISEILNGIRVIKLYAWEPSFIKEVSRLREQEIHYLRQFTFCQSITFLWSCAPFLVALSSFGVYVMVSEENILDAQKAFVSLSLFNILRFPLFVFPMVVSNLIQAFVSLKRLNTFLLHTELDPNSFSREDTPGVAAVIERGIFGWDPKEEPVLRNISIQFPEGQLTSIMGTVGSGKSSLLHALLGNMELFNGRVNVKGSVAYVPQQPWIFNATLRENILFLRPYDPVRYQRVIDACCLTSDLLILPKGDLTEIGDKGINLSGGQKQRVSLARACYADADIYLLDDPLSAVDAHVGLHLLNHVFSRTSGLLASKTCILTTHSSKALPFCDRVALLVDGQLSELGTYRQLLQSRTSRLSAFLADTVLANQSREPLPGAIAINNELSHSKDNNNNAVETGRPDVPKRSRQASTTNIMDDLGSFDAVTGSAPKRSHSHRSTGSSVRSSLEPRVLHCSRKRTISVSSELLNQEEGPGIFDSLVSLSEEQANQNAAEQPTVTKPVEDPSRLIQPERAITGRVKLAIFKIYLRNVGLFYCILILILYPVTNLASFGTSLWLAAWSEDAKSQSNLTELIRSQPELLWNRTAYPEFDEAVNQLHRQRDYRLGVYAALGFLQVTTAFASMLVHSLGHLSCVKKLHNLLLNGILHAPSGFFDTVPAGRIINRFAQDVATVDGPLLSTMKHVITCLLECSLTLCMACAVNAWSVVPVVCLTALYLLLQNIYVANSRQLKRIESIARSPIFSHFSETLHGVECIRAYGLNERYRQLNAIRLDLGNSATYASMISQRWLAILLESVGNLVILSVALFAVSSRGQMSAGFSGLVISYALSLNNSLNWLVRMTADLENDIVCVERIDEYSRVEPEAPWEIPESKPASDWPTGQIEFINYGTRYRPHLDLVLRSINVKVNRGERIGIVGRTGSGKSSLVMALFRMLEASEGQIRIDGIDISQLGLHDLRGRLTLIPQDPVLFSGTLRFNLDPFDRHTDSELWTTLELANLKNYVKETSNGLGLDMVISEGGSNISMGQRQLVCLARALLRRTPILVLDEATAAVDPVTDGLIQETIRREFSHCTVLTIAHRLNTILDYDRIILLQDGEVVEIGCPRDLLRDPNCRFYALAKDAHIVE